MDGLATRCSDLPWSRQHFDGKRQTAAPSARPLKRPAPLPPLAPVEEKRKRGRLPGEKHMHPDTVATNPTQAGRKIRRAWEGIKTRCNRATKNGAVTEVPKPAVFVRRSTADVDGTTGQPASGSDADDGPQPDFRIFAVMQLKTGAIVTRRSISEAWHVGPRVQVHRMHGLCIRWGCVCRGVMLGLHMQVKFLPPALTICVRSWTRPRYSVQWASGPTTAQVALT